MIIDESLLERFLEVYMNYHRDSSVSPLLFDVDFNVLLRNRANIVDKFPRSLRGTVDKLVDNILENREKMTRGLKLVDPDFTRLVQAYFEKETRKFGVKIFENDKKARPLSMEIDPYTVAEYFPVEVMYEKGGRERIGYLFRPSNRDMEKVTKINMESINEILSAVLEESAEYSFKDNTVTIGSRTYRFDETSFFNVMTRVFGMKPSEYIAKKIVALLPDELRGKAKVDPSSIYRKVEITLKLGEYGEELPEEFANAVIALDFISDSSMYPDVIISASMRHDALLIEDVRTRVDVGELRRGINRVLGRIASFAVKHKEHVMEIMELKNKTSLSVKTATIFDGPKTYPGYIMDGEGKRITIALTDDGYRARAAAWEDVSRREIPERLVVEELEKNGVDVSNIKITSYGGMLKAEVHLNNAVSAWDVYNLVEKISTSLKSAVAKYDSMKRVAKAKAERITPEHVVAIYLLNEFLFADINPDLVIGRSKTYVYKTTADILRRLDPERYRELRIHYRSSSNAVLVEGLYDVIDLMMDKKYLTISDNGDVLLNGKPVVTLLKEVNTGLPENVLKGYNDYLLVRLVSRRMVSTGTSDLRKLGYAKPEIISTLIRNRMTEINPVILASEYNGKPVWRQLSEDVKEKYIKFTPIDNLYKILSDNSLQQVFKDSEELILSALVRRDWKTGTEYLAKHKPELIGITDTGYKVENGFIHYGNYLVQVVSLDEPRRDVEKKFIVYGIKEKIGVPVNATNVGDAVRIVDKEYRKFIDELNRLKKMSELTKSVKLWKKTVHGNYGVYMVIHGEQKMLATPGILDKIGSMLEEEFGEYQKESA